MFTKVYITTTFNYKILAMEGMRFCPVLVSKQTNLFNKRERDTLVFGLGDKVLSWSSSLNYSSLSEEAWENIFKSVLIPDTMS